MPLICLSVALSTTLCISLPTDPFVGARLHDIHSLEAIREEWRELDLLSRNRKISKKGALYFSFLFCSETASPSLFRHKGDGMNTFF
jgi:hypothetical protein